MDINRGNLDTDGISMSVEINVLDPLAIQAAQLIEMRSNAGSIEYGHDSLLDRNIGPEALLDEAIEESVDQLMYLLALRARLGAPRNG